METPDGKLNRGRVVVLEPNTALRVAIVTLLRAETYDVDVADTLERVVDLSNASGDSVALVAWQAMQGLLAEEHRDTLIEITRHMRLVVMVPRAWARLLENTDLATAVAALIAKPFQADELLATLDSALETVVDTADHTAGSVRN